MKMSDTSVQYCNHLSRTSCEIGTIRDAHLCLISAYQHRVEQSSGDGRPVFVSYPAESKACKFEANGVANMLDLQATNWAKTEWVLPIVLAL